MKVIIGIGLILAIAFVGSRWSFTKLRIPLVRGSLYLTGTEYLLVGLCLGDLLLGLLDERTLRGLHPLLDLALGWIGLMFGSQLELSQIARFPRQYLLLAALQALSTLLACLLACLWIFPHLGPGTDRIATTGALALAAIAVPTAQSSLALIQQDLRGRPNRSLELLRYVAGLDAVVGLAAFACLFSLEQRVSLVGLEPLLPLQHLVLSVVLGLAMGLLLHLLTRIRCTQHELLLFTMGISVFGAGAAVYVRLSPLFVALVGGVVVANVRGQKTRILRALVVLEQPLYLIVVLVAGARFRPVDDLTAGLLLGVCYILVRVAGKAAGGLAASLLFRHPLRLPPSVGLGLVSQGGMAAAMMVSFHRAFPGEVADLVLLAVLMALVINELVSPALARAVVQKET